MRPSTRRRVILGGSGVLVLAVAGAAFALTSGSSHKGYDGDAIAPALPRPTQVLTDTSGKPFPIARGKATLVYFGYTHCPDLCPTTMADIQVALSHVSPSVRNDTQVVFVTVDPKDDTPTAIRNWLDGFDNSFIGLTGPYSDILGMGNDLLAGVATTEPQSVADVQHGGELIGVSPDGGAPVAWVPSDGAASKGPSLQAQLEHDLPMLVKGVGA